MKPKALLIPLLAVPVVLALLTFGNGVVTPSRTQGAPACCLFVCALNAAPVPVATNAAAPEVVAYYFHGTVRCVTCLNIEQQAKTVIEEKFAGQLAAKQLAFLSVDYDLPANKHFLDDYKLPCPSLVLVQRQPGQRENWKILGKTWDHAHEPAKLKGYVAAEVNQFLGPGKQQTRTNHATPAAPAQR
jgi:hypothetical protein